MGLGNLQKIIYPTDLSTAQSFALRQGLHTTMRPLAGLEAEALSTPFWKSIFFQFPLVGTILFNGVADQIGLF